MALEERTRHAPEHTLAVVKLLAGSSAEPRLAMRGSSMAPLLREPMVLKLGPSGPDDRVGDILVFERDGQLVAHRITGTRGGILQTCGDALPWSPEYPDAAAVVGKVVAVLADETPHARRVDTWSFRLRGAYKARMRALRALPFRAWLVARRALRALPWARPRPYVALVMAMSAAVRKDKPAFERGSRSADASAIVAVARRHGCSAMLVDAASSMHSDTQASAYLRRSLQSVGRSVVLRAIATRAQVIAVAQMLSQAGVPFALLKGAARLYRDDPGATLHASSDLDILVPRPDLEAAVAALHAHGYNERDDDERQRVYREHHHHAAPLYPPAAGCVVELHVALAPPGTLSIPLDWKTLEPHLNQIDGPAGRLRALDDVGTALHYAVHSLGLHRLRDTVLFAQVMLRLQPRELEELRSIIKSEQTDPIRLDAAVAFSARMAGVPWPTSGPVEEYLRWCMRREDMPLYFGLRSQLAEGWFGADRRLTPLVWRLLDPGAGLGPSPGNKPASLALAGRAAASICAYLYACAMRPAA